MSGFSDPFPQEETALVRWFDANIRHQIGLLRVAGGLRNATWALLDATEEDLRREIERRMRKHTGTGRPADVARRDKLLREVAAIRNTAWREAKKLWVAEATNIAIAEPKFMAAILDTVLPVQLSPTLPSARQLRAIVGSRPFEGRILRDWADSVGAADVARIQGQIQVGLVQGEDLGAITRRVVGTAKLGGTDGVTALGRRDAEAITRTAVNHIANQARREFFLENADIVSKELFVATLDSATTPVCRSYDGDLFPLGKGPIPPLHFRCRSVRTGVPDGRVLGERPLKPVTERMLLREFAAHEGFAKTPKTRDALPHGTRGKFDKFARARTRELIGRVPAKTTYQQMLKRQSKAFQEDILGVTRAKLFRTGKIDLKGFVDRKGAEIPLSRLARLHADAFRAAGLEPAEFLTR